MILLNKTFKYLTPMAQFYRVFIIFSVILGLIISEKSNADLAKLYKQKKYETIVSQFETGEEPPSYKDFAFLVLAHKKLNNVNKIITVLEKAVKKYPDKDVLKRELSLAYENKSNTFTQSLKHEEIKKEYFIKAISVLDELKEKKPTPENLTAFIHFYIRNKNFTEANSLLEIYSRDFPKGKNYYSLLCEAQFKQAQFTDAIESCGYLVKEDFGHDLANIYYIESLEEMGRKELVKKELQELPSRFPASANVHLELGKRFLESGESEKGLAHLKKHIDIDPSDEGLVLAAEEMFLNKNFDGALETYIKACQQHKEPRKPLILKLRSASKKIPKSHPLAKRYELEVDRCKYQRRFGSIELIQIKSK